MSTPFDVSSENVDWSSFNPVSEATAFSRYFYPFNSQPGFESQMPVGVDGKFPYSHDYTWMMYASIIFGFFTAYGIGANDVANAFATSVGAKALKVWQAVIIAAIFEFAGAVGLGAGVTGTVRKGIVDVDLFVGHEDWLMVGMLCTVIVVGFWLFLATFLELPVSTTHSTVGGIIGFALAAPNGAANVKWDKVAEIVISWFASPGLSGVVAALIYYFVRASVLRSKNSFERALVFFPLLVAFTVTLNAAYMIFKGIKNKIKLKNLWDKSDEDRELKAGALGMGISLAIGVLSGLIIWCVFVPMMRKNLSHIPDEPAESADQVANIEDKKEGDEDVETAKVGVLESLQHNVHDVVETDARVSSIHENAERFSLRTERAFAYLQVFTAIFDSFSHGANDVANSIGPLAAVYGVWEAGPALYDQGEDEVAVETWILAIGGAGIVVGLATYGYKIMSAIGVKMVKITPSRGFAIELGAAFVIVTGTFLDLPLSTTHCQVGATIGVGLLEKNFKEAVNFKLLAKVFAGWVFTLVVAGAGAALLFSFAVYAPSINAPVSIENCLTGVAVQYTSDSTTGVDVSGGLFIPPMTNDAQNETAIAVIAGNPFTGEYVVGSDDCLNGKQCPHVAWTDVKVGTTFEKEE